MQERPLRSIASTTLVGLAMLVASDVASAQSGAKVLTPPKPADTAARRPVATRPAAATTPGAAVPPAVRPPITVPQTPVLDSIRQVVFHSLLDRDRSGFATLASAFCLALSNGHYK